MTCSAGTTRWDGQLTDFSGSYRADPMLQIYGSVVPGPVELGSSLESDPTDSTLWMGGLVVGVTLTMLLLVVLLWKCLWPACRRHTQRRPWKPGTYRLLALLIALLLLAGLVLPAWAAGQTLVTTSMPAALRSMDKDARELVEALQASLDQVLAQADLVSGALVDYEDEVELAIDLADPNALVRTALATNHPNIATLDPTGSVRAAIADYERTLTELDDGIATLDDTIEGSTDLKNELILPWEPEDYKPVEDVLDTVWMGVTTTATVMMVLLGGITSTLVLQAWHYHGVHQRRRQASGDTDFDPQKIDNSAWERWARQDSCCYNTTRWSLTTMAWLGVILGVLLAATLTAVADLTTGTCRDPHSVIDAYLTQTERTNIGVRLARYYLLANKNEQVYHCEFPLVDDVASVRDSIGDLIAAIEEMGDLEASIRAMIVVGGTTPTPLSGRVAALGHANTLDRLFLETVHGVADAAVISRLIDSEFELLCNEQGKWIVVAAVCYTATVLVVLVLNVIVVLLRDERRGDKDNLAGAIPLLTDYSNRDATSEEIGQVSEPSQERGRRQGRDQGSTQPAGPTSGRYPYAYRPLYSIREHTV